MADSDRFATIPLAPIQDGNEVFQAAIGCIRLAAPLAGHLLRDRLRTNGIDIRSVTVADIQAVLPELGDPIRSLADETAARESMDALKRFVAR